MMKLSFDSVSRHKGLVSVALICGLTAVGCSKKNDDKVDVDADQQQINAEATESSESVSNVSNLQCDDQAISAQLTQAVQSAVNAQTQNLFTRFADRAGANLSFKNANEAVDSILVDVANPTVLQEANADGMVTCNASLSLTLPNKDVTRANQVYKTLEDGSLSDYLKAQNITLNNNMLVSNNFNYVVGMQNGQATARIVGTPAVITAAADIVARSQFKVALDASRSGPATSKPRNEPQIPSEPRTRSEPKPRPEPEQNQRSPVQREKPAAPVKPVEPKVDKAPEPVAPAKPTIEKPNNTNSAEPKPSDAKSKPSYDVPQDDSIEMVIIEEDGTY